MIASALKLADWILLPNLNLQEVSQRQNLIVCESVGTAYPCPKCQTPCSKGYDWRWCTVRDVSLTQTDLPYVKLRIKKKRLYCKSCRKPFLPELPGIKKRRRTTERFRAAVMHACENYVSLKQVCTRFKISSDFAYTALYEQLELKRRKDNQYPWPSAIGIDEHGFGSDLSGGKKRAFVSMIVNHPKRKLMEVVFGRSYLEMASRLAHIPGRENVKYATIDMCDPYRKFIREFFPQAKITADKFHVLRLMSTPILVERKKITGTNADRKAKGLLLMNSKNLAYPDRLALRRYLEKHPKLSELYHWKEALHGFYRIRGQRRAHHAFAYMTERMKLSSLPEIKRLRNTLVKWQAEILNYFETRLTNARLEGFNCKASLVRRRAYGYRNPNNYRLRLLSVCS
jgi:transposase